MSSLLRVIEEQGALRVFAEVVRGSGLAGALAAGRCTLFAPTDDAFAELPAGALAALLASPPRLAGLLARHTAPRRWPSEDLVRAGRVELLCGHLARVSLRDGLLILGGGHAGQFAAVVRADVPAGGSLLHLLDTVL